MINLGSRRLNLAFALVSIVTLTSCSTVPRSIEKGQLQSGSRIGVVSATADYARLGHVGMTVFNNEHFYAPLDEFALDDRIEAEALRAQGRERLALTTVAFDRKALFHMYDTHGLDNAMLTRPLFFKADLERVQDDLVQIASSNHVDRLLLVTKAVCDDRFGWSNQKLNGFGLYHGRYVVGSALMPRASTQAVTMAYLCADVTLYDPATRSVIASRRITTDGDLKPAVPAAAIAYWVKSLDGIPADQRETVINAFARLASSVAPSVASLLGDSAPERSTAR